jgi:hypothetical protein
LRILSLVRLVDFWRLRHFDHLFERLDIRLSRSTAVSDWFSAVMRFVPRSHANETIPHNSVHISILRLPQKREAE